MLNKKNFKKILQISTPLFIFLFFLSANSAFSQGDDYGLKETAGKAGVMTNITAPEFLGNIAGAALAIAGSLFLFLMVYGGITILTSAGNETKVKKGKEIITWAIIGAIVLGAAYAITNLVFQAVSGGGQ